MIYGTFGNIVVDGVDTTFVPDDAVISTSAGPIDLEGPNLVSVSQEHGREILRYAVLAAWCEPRITSACVTTLCADTNLSAIIQLREGALVQVDTRLVVNGRHHETICTGAVETVG